MEQRFLTEATRNLEQMGFQTQTGEHGFLQVEWEGSPLCRVIPDGEVRYRSEEVYTDGRLEALTRVTAAVEITSEYTGLMENAAPLRAKSLNGDYKLLAEFNDSVLAGHMTKHGVQFMTWGWDYDHTGLVYGHYFPEGCSGYRMAKQDFAVRSALVQEEKLFSPEQMAEIYRSIQETLDSSFSLPVERERLLNFISGQIERAIPDLERRLELSIEQEIEAGGEHRDDTLTMDAGHL